jgi:Holliday junction resolvasome RuvABC endonuclease subunit
MNILSLDLGTKTGYAIHQRGGQMTAGSESFAPKLMDGVAARAFKFKRFLPAVTQGIEIQVCYYERVLHHSAVQAAHVYGLLEGLLQMWADTNNVRLVAVSPKTIKKFWTGTGNANKILMMSECEKRGFRVGKDDDMSDAIALLHYAIEQEGICLPDKQKKETLQKVDG